MTTLGLWLGPTVAVLLVAAGNKWLGWFQPRSRRRIAIRRIAERLASDDSQGYPHLYDRYLEHFLGGRAWDEEWDKASTEDEPNGDFYDSRGSAPKWWQRIGSRSA